MGCSQAAGTSPQPFARASGQPKAKPGSASQHEGSLSESVADRRNGGEQEPSHLGGLPPGSAQAIPMEASQIQGAEQVETDERPLERRPKPSPKEILDFTSCDDELLGALNSLRSSVECNVWAPAKSANAPSVTASTGSGSSSTRKLSTAIGTPSGSSHWLEPRKDPGPRCRCLEGHPMVFMGTSVRPACTSVSPRVYEWSCSRSDCPCSSSATPLVGRFHCRQCHYDLCGRCAHALRSDSWVRMEVQEIEANDCRVVAQLDRYMESNPVSVKNTQSKSGLLPARSNPVVRGDAEGSMPGWDFTHAVHVADSLDLGDGKDGEDTDGSDQCSRADSQVTGGARPHAGPRVRVPPIDLGETGGARPGAGPRFKLPPINLPKHKHNALRHTAGRGPAFGSYEVRVDIADAVSDDSEAHRDLDTARIGSDDSSSISTPSSSRSERIVELQRRLNSRGEPSAWTMCVI